MTRTAASLMNATVIGGTDDAALVWATEQQARLQSRILNSRNTMSTSAYLNDWPTPGPQEAEKGREAFAGLA